MKSLLYFTAGCLVVASVVPAMATSILEVQVDKSRVIELNGTPGAIVVGNPSIADVTTHGNKLFIHGRNFGETNLMVIDVSGNTIMDFNLITRNANENAVAIFKANNFRPARRESFSCYPVCESDIQVGDDLGFFKTTIEEASDKMEFATGSETSEAKAPAAPQ